MRISERLRHFVMAGTCVAISSDCSLSRNPDQPQGAPFVLERKPADRSDAGIHVPVTRRRRTSWSARTYWITRDGSPSS